MTFLKRWKSAERKQAIIEELENEGLSLDPLAEEVGKDLDPFDLICHVAFDQPPLTRRERAENVRKRNVFTKYGPQARAVLEALAAKVSGSGCNRSWRPTDFADSAARHDGNARPAHQGIRDACGFHVRGAGTPIRALSEGSLTHVCSQHRQIDTRHHAPGFGVDGDAQRISQLCWMFFLKIIDDQDQQLELMQDGYHSPIPAKLRWRSWAADPEGITGEELLTFINTQLFPQLKELSTTGKQGDRRRVVRDVFEDAYNYMKSGQLMRQVINKINEVDFNNLAERQHFGDIYEQILNDLQSAGNAGEYYTPRAVTAFMVDRIDPRPGEILLDPACGTGGFLTCAIRHMRERYVKKVEDEQQMQARSARRGEEAAASHALRHQYAAARHRESQLRAPRQHAGAAVHQLHASPTAWTSSSPIRPSAGSEEDGIESNFPKHFQTRETADLFLALIIRLLKPGGRAAVVLPDGSLFGEGVKTRLKEHLMEECNLHTIVRLPNSVFKPYASIGTNLLFFEKGEPTKDIWFYEHRVPDGQKAYSMTKPIRIEHLKPCVDWWGGAKRKGRVETEVAWKVTADEVKARGYNLDFKNPHTVADDHGDPRNCWPSSMRPRSKPQCLRDQLKAILAEALLR